jgi:hypothetical protein
MAGNSKAIRKPMNIKQPQPQTFRIVDLPLLTGSSLKSDMTNLLIQTNCDSHTTTTTTNLIYTVFSWQNNRWRNEFRPEGPESL